MPSEHHFLRRRARQSWRMLRRRAVDPRLDARKSHGVCARWLCGLTGFDAFLADVGLPPALTHVLLRRDQTLPWGRLNAYWSADRSRLRTPAKLFVSAFGYRMTVGQWARAAGMSDRLLRYRLLRMSAEQALVLPVRGGTRRNTGDALVAMILEFAPTGEPT